MVASLVLPVTITSKMSADLVSLSDTPVCIVQLYQTCILGSLIQISICVFVKCFAIRQGHTGQCKRTGDCYNELVVAFYSTGGGVKGKNKIYTC